jgi:hypothetical protein
MYFAEFGQLPLFSGNLRVIFGVVQLLVVVCRVSGVLYYYFSIRVGTFSIHLIKIDTGMIIFSRWLFPIKGEDDIVRQESHHQ